MDYPGDYDDSDLLGNREFMWMFTEEEELNEDNYDFYNPSKFPPPPDSPQWKGPNFDKLPTVTFDKSRTELWSHAKEQIATLLQKLDEAEAPGEGTPKEADGEAKAEAKAKAKAAKQKKKQRKKQKRRNTLHLHSIIRLLHHQLPTTLEMSCTFVPNSRRF